MRIFLPHSSRDKTFALQLADALKEASFEPWLYERSIEPQSNWVVEINRGLKEADLTLLLWSQAAADSYATQLEWTASLAREIADRRRRLAIILLDTHPIEPVLSPKQHIDASRDPAQGIRETIAWLKGHRDLQRMTGGNAPVHLPDYKPANFIGRLAQLATLRTALADQVGEMLISGEPGGGKSTLALQFAWQTQKDFDAVVFQSCGPRPVSLIAGELADKLKEQLGEAVTQLPPDEKLKAALSWLKQRRTLLVLDNVSPDIKDLVPGPPVSVVHTSRRHSLPWLASNQVIHLNPFTPEETEALFRASLGSAIVDRHKTWLLDFAARMQWLPIAVAVGAAMLRDQYGPTDKAARTLMLSQLTDVAALLDRAIEAQGEAERGLLAAAAICAPETFWFPLASDIARLDEDIAATARDNLVNASLLRVIDRDRQRFQLHALLRERLCVNDSQAAELRARHAAALESLFTDWEQRWEDCRECLEEIIPAMHFLWDGNYETRLSSHAFALAYRIGDLAAALRIMQSQERLSLKRNSNDHKAALGASYANQATILQTWGQLNEALALLKQAEAIFRELGHDSLLHISYGNQAVILKTQGRMDEALALHTREEMICRHLGEKDGLQRSYSNQAGILLRLGRLEEALNMYKQQEVICRELGNRDGVQLSYSGQAIILHLRGKLEEAFSLHKKAEAICRELGDQNGLQRSYGNQGHVLKDWGRLDEAFDLYRRQETICMALGNRDGLQLSYGSQAEILGRTGRLNEALDLLKRQEAICLELGNKDSLQISYGNQANIWRAWGRLDEALALLKKKAAICRELNNKSGLAYCYWNWGLLASVQNEPDAAREKLQHALALFTEVGMPREIAGVNQDLESLDNPPA